MKKERQTYRKILVFFLAFILTITLAPGLAFASDDDLEPLVPPKKSIDDFDDLGPLVPNSNSDFDDLQPLVPPPKKNIDDFDDLEPLVPSKPPIEIEVPPDGEDLDMELVRKQLEEKARLGFWRMKFEDAVYVAPWSFAPDMVSWKKTLNLTLDQEGPGGGDMYGSYSGEGTLELEADTTGTKEVMAGLGGVLDVFDMTGDGPLKTTIWLDPIDPDKADEDLGKQVYDNLNYDDPIAPMNEFDEDVLNTTKQLVKNRVGDIVGYGGSFDATWEASGLAMVHAYDKDGEGEAEKDAASGLEMFIAPFVFSSGVVKLHVYPRGPAQIDAGYFWGRISRVVNGKELS